MLATVEGTYRDGRVELLETPEEVPEEARVIVTFLETHSVQLRQAENNYVDLRERGIDEPTAAAIRASLETFAEDWDDSDMDIYDDYETEIAKL